MGATSMASGLGGAGGIGGGSESGVIGDIMAQLQALFYRKMHLNVTQMGHSPASPPVALPRLNKTMALQMPAVTSALRRLQESLVGLAAAGSLTIPELIEKLDTCAKVFPPKSRPLAAARVFAFETLAAALARIIERGERSRAFAIRSLQGLEPAHINLLLDGLVAPIVAVDFVDNFGGGVLSKPMAIAGQSMDADANSHSTGSINAATAAVIGAMAAEAEKCLASLSNFMLVLVVNGVCDRFMGVQPSLQQDQGQSHLNIQSIGWEGQVKYLLATSRWKFGLIDPPMRSSTCRFLRAVLEFVVPSATRTAQKKVVVTCLVGIWRTLMAETRATPQANIQWQELLENEEDQLQVYLDIHGEAFTLMQKWARKTKLRVHALSLMQVLLCHGTFEFFRSSKQREHFTITVMAACGDQACRPDVLDVLAAYIREVPSIFISQIREAWRLEAMNLMSSAFPRSKAAPVAELRPLTDCLVALGASELEHTVGAITNLLASSRHHSSHKIVALRALARLLRDNPPLEIGRQKEELITMVTACLKEKDQPFLIGEALRCVPMLLVMATDGPGKWMFYEREKEGEKRQREDGKEALVPGTILKHGLTQAEVLNLMRELCWWSDRTIALEATVALRENIHMLPMHLLSAALRIACRTITNSLNAVAEDWRRRLTDVEAVLYEFLRRFSPRGSKMAQHFSRMCSSRGSSLSGTILPGSSGGHHHQSSVSEGASRQGEQSTGLDGGSIAKGSGGGGDGGLSFAKGIDLPTPAQWARIRVKVEGIVVLALAHHDRTVWMQAYQLLRLLDHDLFRAIEEPSLRDNGVLSHRPSPRASPRRTPSRYDRFGSGRYSGYGFGLQSVIPSSGFRGGSRDGMHSRRPSADVERPPFLADCLLRKPLSAVDLDVWRTRGAWCNVHWAPELWYLLLQQYDRYEVCLQWAWSKIVNHNIWSLCPKARSQATNPQSPRPPPGPVGQSGAVVSPPAVVRVTSLVGASGLLVQPPVVDASKSTSGITDTGGKIKGLTPEMMDGAFQLWRNLLHFAILCLRLPNHPEFDLEEAARNLDKYDAKGEDRNRGLSVGFNTAKKYMVEFTDSQAKAWIRKRRMPRVSVQHCLRRAWEQAYASGMTSGTPEISALLTSLEALDPTCHEALILEMKGSEVDRMNRIHGNVEKKQGQKVVKKPEGQSEASSGKGPSFYYQESVLELLSQLYKRTLADAYRAGPVPVRSALEEFVSQWVQDQDDSRFEKLSLKVRIYAISMIENYLLYTTASLKAVASQAASANVVGSSTEDSSPLNTLQQKSLVPSLSYRQKVFRNLTVKWVRGARSAAAKSQRLGGYARVSSSVDSSGVVSENPDATGDTDAGSVGYPASDDALSDGQGDEESAILELEIAVARAVKALIGMGPVNDSPFETDILRFLQNHHSKGGPVVRENVREALAQLLEHNAHRLKNFIAASFKLTWIRKSVDKLEAKELALTYFRALVQTVSRRVDDWLNAHIVSPAKMSYLCLLHMCSHNEPMRHLALELINAIEAACPNPTPPGWGILPASAHAPPDVYIEAAVATSRSLANAHPEYTPAVLREALALQPCLSKETLPTMLSIVIPWAENFCTVFLAEQEKVYQLRVQSSQQVNDSSSNPCTPRSVSERAEFNASARSISLNEKYVGGVGSGSAGSNHSAVFDSPGKEVPGVGSRGGSGLLLTSKTGKVVSGLNQLQLLESRLSFGSFADSLDGYSVGSDGVDTMEDMGVPSGNGHSQSFAGNVQVSRSQILQSEWMLLCVFQMTKLCGWPPLHAHQLRALWEAVLSAPEHSRDLVAVYVTEFLLHSHMSGADPPEFSGYIQRGGSTVNGYGRDSAGSLSQQKHSGSRLGGRPIYSRSNSASRVDTVDESGMSVGLDQRLAKLVVSYIMSSASGPLIFQRLLANVRSYTLVAGSDNRGSLSIAWESARFTSWAVSAQEHSALVLLTDTAYQQDYVLVPHLPTLLQCAIVLLRPRIEHRCPESHALIPYIVHSLAVRCAPHKKVRELAQEFINKFYPSRAPLAHIAPIPGMEHQEPGGPLDPEECLSTPFVLELVSLLSYHRPRLRVDWAEMALSWTIHSTDKRIVLDSLRVFTVLNQSISISLLAKVGRLLLASIRIEEHGVADALLEIFGKASMILKKETEMPRSEEPSEALASSWLETWDMLSSVALTAMTSPSIRIFHRAITLVESLFCLQSLMTDTIQLVVSLEPFWRVISEVPLDVAISDLLFRGLLSTKTAPSTLWMYETFATAYADWLSADNKLVVMVLLLNAALVEMGEQGRCRAVIRFIENCGFALNDISAVFTAHEEGLYRPGGAGARQPSKQAGEKATVPIPSSEGSADNTKPSFASKGSAEGGQENASKAEDGGKAGNNGSTTEWTEHERHDGVSQTATQEPSSSRRVSRRDMLPGPIGAYSADGYQFFDDFFDAFSLVFPSEEVWTFALKSVIALIVRGQQLWRAPFMKLLRSLLLYHVHAWSEEHFGMVADMLVQISSVEGTEIEEGMKQKGSAVREDPALVSAKEDIRAIIVECASFSVSQRVVDALHICLEMDRLKKEGSPGELRGSFRKSFSFPKNRGSSAFEGYEHQSTPSIADELFPGYSFGDPEIGVLKDWAGRWFLEYILPRRLGGSGEEDIQRDLRSDDTSGTVKREGTSSPKNAAGSTVKTSEDFGRTNDAKQEAQDEGMVEDKVGKIPCPSAEVDDGLWGTVKMDMEEIGDKDDKAVNTKLPQPCEERALEEASFAIEKLRPKSDTVDHVSRAEVMRAKQQYAAPVEAEEEEDEHERSKKIEMVRGMLERGERMDDSKAASTGTGTETTTRTLQGHEVRAREISSPEVAEGVSGVEKAALAVEKEHNEEASGRVEKGIHTAEEEEDYKDDAAARDSSDESDDEGLEHETGRRESLVVEVKEVTLGRREKITLSEQPANEMPLPVEEAQKSGVENMGVSSKPVADDDGFGQEIGDEEAGMVGRQRVANDDGSEKEDESSDDDDTELQSLVERLELDESENEDDSAEVQQRVERLMMSVRGSMNFEENDLIEEDFDEEANVERGGTEEGSSAVEHDTEEMWNDRNRELVEGEEIQGEEREAELVEDVAEYEGEGEMNIGMGAVRDQRCKGEDGRPTQQDEASNVISGTELQNADEEEVEGSLVAASGDRHALAEEETEVLAEREMSESVEATDVKTKQEEPRRTQLPLMVQRANAINAIIEEQRLRMSPTREEFDRRYGRQLLDGLGRTGSTGEDGLFGRPRPMASIGFGYRLGFTLDVKIKKPTIKKGEEEKSEAETDVSETGDMPEDVFDEDSSKLPMSPLPQETEVEDDEESSDGEDMRSEFYDDESVQEESAWGAAGGRGHDRGFSVGSPFEGLYIDQLQEMEVENRTRGAAGTDFGHLQVEIDRSGPLEHRLMMPLKFPVNQIDRLKNDWNAPSPGAREKSGVKFGVGGFYGMWGGGVDADMKESESSSNRSSIGDGNAAHVPEHKRANSFSSEGSSTSGDPEDGGTGVVGDGRGLPQANEPHTFIFRPGDRGYGREPERGPMDTSMLQSWADEDEQQHHSLRSSPGFGVDRDSFAKADEERQGSGRRPVFERGRSSLLRRWLG